jgi:hypothetical protein
MFSARAQILFTLLLCCILQSVAPAQQVATSQNSPVVPPLVDFTGVLAGEDGKPLVGTVGVTFALYSEQEGGSPLWMETQNILPDKNGHYAVMLGSTTSAGIPADLFVAGEARWLGAQVAGQPEKARVLLVAVPYALKAADAETIGGLPASAFMRANSKAGTTSSSTATSSSKSSNGSAPPVNPKITGTGTVNYIPLWDKTTDIVNSRLFQKNDAIGVGTTTPAAALDVNGQSDIRDTLTLFPKRSDSTLAINGTSFKIDHTGKVTFVSGQTFPGTGTITGVTTSNTSGLQGGGTSGTLNLSVKSAGITNAMLQNSSLKVSAGTGLTGGGSVALGGSTSLAVDFTLVPELGAANTFTNSNAISVDGSNPALTLANPNGDGLDVSSAGSNGIRVAAAGSDGIAAFGNNAGGYFNGPGFGSYSVATADSNFAAAVYGGGMGSTQETFGVSGYSASGAGIGTYGQAVSASVEGGTISGSRPIGVWGDSGAETGIGVLGSADTGVAIYGINNGDGFSPGATAYFENDENVADNDPVLVTLGGAYGGYCTIDVSGNVVCNGASSAVVPVDGRARKVALYAVESPENWFEDAGSGQLSNGSAVISLESTFAQTVNTEMEYHVFLTPKGDCEGLYVSNETVSGFEVHELRHGHSSVGFDYRIMAKRTGYENIRLADKTKQFAPRPKRTEGPRPHMPTAQEIRKAQEAHLHAGSLAK